MEQGFPLEAYRSAAVAAAQCHGFFLTLAMATALVLYMTSRRPARQRDMFWWSAAICVTGWTTAFMLPNLVGRTLFTESERFRAVAITPYVLAYTCLIWSLALGGMVQTYFRLRRQGQPTRVVDGLVLIASFLTLIPLLMPTISGTTQRGRCASRLRAIGVALNRHQESLGAFPASRAGTPAVSWRVALLPYFSNDHDQERFRMYDRNQPWDAVRNLELATSTSPYNCPANLHQEDALHRRYTDYAMLTGRGSLSDNPVGPKLAEITDGASTTIALVEVSGLQIVWTEPRDVNVTTQPLGINLLGKTSTTSPGVLSSYHLRGAHVLMADGSVRFLSQSLDPALLTKLTTIAGDETIDGSF